MRREPRSFEANHLLGKALDEMARRSTPSLILSALDNSNPATTKTPSISPAPKRTPAIIEQARDNAQALLARHDTAELHHLLGDVQEKLGHSLEAVREYQQAVALDPREPYVFDWGSELLLHHAPEPALEVFSKGNRLFPRSVRMLIGAGRSRVCPRRLRCRQFSEFAKPPT